MKLICKKSGDPCRLCMAGVIPNVIECPNLLRVDDPPQETETPDEPDEPPAE